MFHSGHRFCVHFFFLITGKLRNTIYVSMRHIYVHRDTLWCLWELHKEYCVLCEGQHVGTWRLIWLGPKCVCRDRSGVTIVAQIALCSSAIKVVVIRMREMNVHTTSESRSLLRVPESCLGHVNISKPRKNSWEGLTGTEEESLSASRVANVSSLIHSATAFHC